MSSELLTVSEAARWAKCSESFLNKCRITGSGPRFIRIGRSIRYRQSDLEAWAAGHAAASTSEYGAQP
jgi:predicted DNA-binding transcriptional regulator AlpA